MIHVGFNLPVVNWIMRCISSVSYVILINGAASEQPKESTFERIQSAGGH